MTQDVQRSAQAQNRHLTFKANMGVGRHGWLRLTPAYSLRLVRERMAHLPEHSVVTDPFSGTGTTPLAAAEHNHLGQSLDINPFLVWLGTAKTRHMNDHDLDIAESAVSEVARAARVAIATDDLWAPAIHHIERWWSPGALLGLQALRIAIDGVADSLVASDLFSLALCRTLIAKSNAAFNHQSMSFKESDGQPTLLDLDETELTIAAFEMEALELVGSARFDLMGSARIYLGDSRDMAAKLEPADMILTSPPYVNRMSYIRELRPYMYWLRFLESGAEAGELDWQAIGGTWGSATSRVGLWKRPEGSTNPVDEAMDEVLEMIASDGGKNGPLLSRYVGKYFHDMWLHFQAARDHLKPGGTVSYIVGNSTFFGHVVPAQDWYAMMLRELGFEGVEIEVIRKRNSNKSLYEYDVRGRL